jgi:hypothetical protein
LSEDASKPRYTTGYHPELDPYLKAIGGLSIVWAEFEFSIDEAIWELANVERYAGTCMTSQMIGPGPRFRCLVSLLRFRGVPDKLVTAVNALSGQAAGLGSRRNRFVHDPLMLDLKDNSVRRMEATADRIVKHGTFPIEVNDINQLTAEISGATAEFDKLHVRILDETPPWPRIQFEQSPGIHRQRRLPTNSPTKPYRPQRSSRT